MVWDRMKVVLIVPLVQALGYIASFGVCIAGGFMEPTKQWFSVILYIALSAKPVYLVLMLIGSCICRENSEWQSYMQSKGYSVALKMVLICIESGILVAVTLLIAIPMYAVNSITQVIPLDIVSPLTGISFFLILMLSLLGLTPAGSPPLRTGRLEGLLRNRPRIPPIKISVEIEAYHSPKGFSSFHKEHMFESPVHQEL